MVYRDPRSGRQLGEALREWREVNEVTLADTAQRCGESITHLLDIENGNCGPSGDILRAYAETCPISPPGHQEGWRTVIAWLQVFRRSHATTNRQRLDIVAESLRVLRNLGPGECVRMRDVEGDIVVSLLDTEQPNLMVDVMGALGLSSSETHEFISASLRRLERRRSAKTPITRRVVAGPDAA